MATGPAGSSVDRTDPVVRRSKDPDELARLVAAHLVARLARIQATGRVPRVVLTGGSIAVRIHQSVAGSPDRDLVDWSRVEFWFGDERFVPAADPDRNLVQAADAMLDHLPVDPDRVHAMAASDEEYGDDVDAAAAAYAKLLRAVSQEGPLFDVLMLGIGPDGHCASLFPGRPEAQDIRQAVAVRDSPKPPPTRISLTLDSLNRAHEVWFVAAGPAKAEAVRNAVHGSDPVDVPAAGPKGLEATMWLLDDAAAARL